MVRTGPQSHRRKKERWGGGNHKNAYLRRVVGDRLYHSWFHRQLTGRRIVVSGEIVNVIVVIHS